MLTSDIPAALFFARSGNLFATTRHFQFIGFVLMSCTDGQDVDTTEALSFALIDTILDFTNKLDVWVF